MNWISHVNRTWYILILTGMARAVFSTLTPTADVLGSSIDPWTPVPTHASSPPTAASTPTAPTSPAPTSPAPTSPASTNTPTNVPTINADEFLLTQVGIMAVIFGVACLCVVCYVKIPAYERPYVGTTTTPDPRPTIVGGPRTNTRPVVEDHRSCTHTQYS